MALHDHQGQTHTERIIGGEMKTLASFNRSLRTYQERRKQVITGAVLLLMLTVIGFAAPHL